MNTVTVVGLGYIGLPTALLASDAQLSVVGFDIDSRRVAAINGFDAVIKEPEIAPSLSRALMRGNFKASVVMQPADVIVIAVPTPLTQEKTADLSYVWHAAQLISSEITPGTCIILESTVPVGTTERFAGMLQELTGLRAGVDFYCAYCPERVLPGKIFYEMVNNSRIIGGINKASCLKAKEFYDHFVKGEMHLTHASTAEMVKLIENSYRDVNIAFAHQVAQMTTEVGLDPYELIELANKHPRVQILHPRCGVGGHCIAVDPWFLVDGFPNQTELLKVARDVNDARPQQVLQRICLEIENTKATLQREPRIVILGITYKPDVDDTRESPALLIAEKLTQQFSQVRVCEPFVHDGWLTDNNLQPISIDESIAWADIMVALVDHTVFKNHPVILEWNNIIDCCGLLYKKSTERDKQTFVAWPQQPSSLSDESSLA
jgi:UDP-N-acetyl-D-mannosaminuronic acid dehydrogenase